MPPPARHAALKQIGNRLESADETSAARSNLGWLYCNQGRYREAAPLTLQTFEIQKRAIARMPEGADPGAADRLADYEAAMRNH
jgi:hypothetical protein